MPIILDMTEEEYNNRMREIANADELEIRLNAIEPMRVYEYRDELTSDDEWRSRYETVERERDDYRRRYIDRFFSGTDLEDREIERTEQIDREEKDVYDNNPMTFEELEREV